jgi:hypothetical protein
MKIVASSWCKSERTRPHRERSDLELYVSHTHEGQRKVIARIERIAARTKVPEFMFLELSASEAELFARRLLDEAESLRARECSCLCAPSGV